MVHLCVFAIPFRHGQDDIMSISNWIQSFPSPGLVAKPKTSQPYYLLIARKERMDSCLSKRHKRKMKHKQPRPGFELTSPRLFPASITIIPRALPIYVYIYIYIYYRKYHSLFVSATAHSWTYVCVCMCVCVCVCWHWIYQEIMLHTLWNKC